MPILDDLFQFGLNEKEAKIYLAALELGPAPILDIARKSRVKRTTIYETLEDLKKKGILSQTIKGKKRLFVAMEPEKIKMMFKKQEEALERLLPELKGLSNLGSIKPKIRYYEGKEEIAVAYDDTLKSQPNEILAFESVNSIADLLGWDYGRRYIHERSKIRKIPERTITNYYSGVELFIKRDEKELRETRVLPKEEQFFTDIEIYGNKVLILSLKKEVWAVLIESEMIGGMMKMMFELIWNRKDLWTKDKPIVTHPTNQGV